MKPPAVNGKINPDATASPASLATRATIRGKQNFDHEICCYKNIY